MIIFTNISYRIFTLTFLILIFAAGPVLAQNKAKKSSSVNKTDALRKLLPETLADSLVLNKVGPAPYQPEHILHARYNTPTGIPMLFIYMSYDTTAIKNARAQLRSQRETMRKLTHDGSTFYLTHEGDGTRLIAIREDMSFFLFSEIFERGGLDPDTAAPFFLGVIDKLDLERIARLDE